MSMADKSLLNQQNSQTHSAAVYCARTMTRGVATAANC
jgi:hypothetical protein